MIDPTTKPGRPAFEPYTQAAAQIIAALVARDGNSVSRADIRLHWYRRYPQQTRSVGKGPVGRARLNGAIRELDQLGIIQRTHDHVRVLDRARLATVANAVTGRGRR